MEVALIQGETIIDPFMGSGSFNPCFYGSGSNTAFLNTLNL